MGALTGIRVLDLGLLVQAPQAALSLSDMGAEVIKVELPGLGDQARWVTNVVGGTVSGFWTGCNRGKRSITVDLRKPEGKEVFLKLADTADVVITNFKPGTLEDWGIGYDVLSARNPRVIVASGSAYGPVGPTSHLEGADLVGQAAGGLISTTGADGDPVTPFGVTICDHMASQNLTIGILAALFARNSTGRGQRVEVSLVGSAIWAQTSELTSYFLTGDVPGRSNNGHPLIHALYGLLPTADGVLAIFGVPMPARQPFCETIGQPSLFEDPRWATPFLTPENRRALFETLRPIFASRNTADWVAALRAGGTRCAPVNDYAALANDPQVYENGYLVKTVDESGKPITIVGTPIKLSDTPNQPNTTAPELGQHTEEILLELGYDWDQIETLRTSASI
jgi:CoA:oxalate CoA-transferase